MRRKALLLFLMALSVPVLADANLQVPHAVKPDQIEAFYQLCSYDILRQSQNKACDDSCQNRATFDCDDAIGNMSPADAPKMAQFLIKKNAPLASAAALYNARNYRATVTDLPKSEVDRRIGTMALQGFKLTGGMDLYDVAEEFFDSLPMDLKKQLLDELVARKNSNKLLSCVLCGDVYPDPKEDFQASELDQKIANLQAQIIPFPSMSDSQITDIQNTFARTIENGSLSADAKLVGAMVFWSLQAKAGFAPAERFTAAMQQILDRVGVAKSLSELSDFGDYMFSLIALQDADSSPANHQAILRLLQKDDNFVKYGALVELPTLINILSTRLTPDEARALLPKIHAAAKARPQVLLNFGDHRDRGELYYRMILEQEGQANAAFKQELANLPAVPNVPDQE